MKRTENCRRDFLCLLIQMLKCLPAEGMPWVCFTHAHRSPGQSEYQDAFDGGIAAADACDRCLDAIREGGTLGSV